MRTLERMALADPSTDLRWIADQGYDGIQARDCLKQTAGYTDRRAADAGHLVIFDRGQRSWKEKVFHRSEFANGAVIEAGRGT